MSAQGSVRFDERDGIGHLTFDRPAARNAMTWEMYDQLHAICERLGELDHVRAVILRGAGGTFVAGTDIAQFQAFRSAKDGIEYEAAMGRNLDALASVPMPTLAVIEGWAVGGGLTIAACCDIRIATSGARLGVPIARTLGNCLSVSNVARLITGFGEGRARRMLLLGETIDAEEALAAGFLARVVAKEAIDEAVDDLAGRLAANAPLTLRASKAQLARLLRSSEPEAEELLALCYGSEDFRKGISAFLDKRRPAWSGR